jgi:hypothetical protein
MPRKRMWRTGRRGLGNPESLGEVVGVERVEHYLESTKHRYEVLLVERWAPQQVERVAHQDQDLVYQQAANAV